MEVSSGGETQLTVSDAEIEEFLDEIQEPIIADHLVQVTSEQQEVLNLSPEATETRAGVSQTLQLMLSEPPLVEISLATNNANDTEQQLDAVLSTDSGHFRAMYTDLMRLRDRAWHIAAILMVYARCYTRDIVNIVHNEAVNLGILPGHRGSSVARNSQLQPSTTDKRTNQLLLCLVILLSFGLILKLEHKSSERIRRLQTDLLSEMHQPGSSRTIADQNQPGSTEKASVRPKKPLVVHGYKPPSFYASLEGWTPDVYVITPTYSHWTQKAELTRVYQAFKLSGVNLHWVLIEDTKFPMASVLLVHLKWKIERESDGRIKVKLLTAKTPTVNEMGHRGVNQRNKALTWVVNNHKNESAVVYFGDDDNTYDEGLLRELTQVGVQDSRHVVGMLPVGTIGGMQWAGPICKNNRLVDYKSKWNTHRAFQLDMAGFTVKVGAIVKSNARFNGNARKGDLETSLLSVIFGISWEHKGGKLLTEDITSRIAMLANCCTEIYVWHTRTEPPKDANEGHFHRWIPDIIEV